MRPQLLFDVWGSAYWPPILLGSSLARARSCPLGWMASGVTFHLRPLQPLPVPLCPPPQPPGTVGPYRALVVWSVPGSEQEYTCDCTCCGWDDTTGIRRSATGIHLLVGTVNRQGSFWAFVREQLGSASPNCPAVLVDAAEAYSTYIYGSWKFPDAPVEPCFHVWRDRDESA